MARIELRNACLTFRVRERGRLTLKELIVRGMFRRTVNPIVEVQALQDVSLTIGDGERIGIVGENGAGKSSLLRLIAGVYPPTGGTAVVNGRISSLFEISLGFEQDATGWENIAFRGYLQGETPRSIAAKRQVIADFSELGHFLSMPVRYYSAGMLVRLAFSIATAIDPEVLLVDEALSAGDLAFQQKARQRMLDLISKAHLMVMVSHDLEAVRDLCTKTIWLDHGRIRKTGPTAEVIAAYAAFAKRAPGRAA